MKTKPLNINVLSSMPFIEVRYIKETVPPSLIVAFIVYQLFFCYAVAQVIEAYLNK